MRSYESKIISEGNPSEICYCPVRAVRTSTRALDGPKLPQPIPVNVQNALGSFAGNLNIQKFAVQNNQLVAVGTLTGVVKNATGGIIGNIIKNVVIPVNLLGSRGTCQILHLELGPLDLDLLGLVVHLDKVVLDITAESGPGNLLGNLLCSVANLLNGGNLGALANVLNQILGILG